MSESSTSTWQGFESLQDLMFTTLKLDFREHILTLTLNRPHKKNAFNRIMLNELIYVLNLAKQQRAIRVVVIAGVGDVFCAGGDLKAWDGDGQERQSTVPSATEQVDPADDLALALYQLHKPLIAKLNGSVYAGGLLIVCNATHAIAADHVVFCAPEIKRGIWPFRVMAGLFRVMTPRQGLDFIMRGRRLDAATAMTTGLVNEVVPAAELDQRVDALAAEFTALAPGTLRMGLEAYRTQQTMGFEEAQSYLTERLEACLQTPDAQEGIAAFVEKRPPKW